MKKQMDLPMPELKLMIPPRPDITKKDKGAIKYVASKLLKKVKDWASQDGDDDVCQKEIEDILSESYDWDGYHLAKRYEEIYLLSNVDANLVEILDDAEYIFANYQIDKIKEWVSEYNIEPKFKVGDKVMADLNRLRYEGEIVRVYNENATYVVYVESMGHVKEGMGTNGIVLAYEKVEAFQNG